MAFLKRLGFFLVGLSIGIVFLTFFFKKKTEETGTEFCYFPNCRVLKDLRSKPLTYSEDIKDLLASNELDSLDINSFFRNGEIDFGKSNAKSVPCRTYVIEGAIKDKKAILEVKNCPSKVIVERITKFHQIN
ncbi:DUF4258 domain-containing protein [Flavobacteriaceae bacterium KMM 6897]|nr:DUF4258 domain-containing protein [Flavobacteriaceae bacterium KMM 6897]MEB8345525.1 DUF4258 domain-containing protein [Flavobacteriaceae bacterium KMM 6898]